MAKAYKKGSKFLLYLNTGSQGSPTWGLINAVTNLNSNCNPADIVVEEQNMPDGHLHGEQDPEITFQLNEESGETNVETLIAAIHSGDMKEIAYANGPIATAGTKYLRLEACFFAPQSSERGAVSKYDVTAKRHADSAFGMTRTTVPS
jgi:hypothetical protein